MYRSRGRRYSRRLVWPGTRGSARLGITEPLRIEISAKFRRNRFALEAAHAGLRIDTWWTDPEGDFAVALLTK